MRIEFDDPEDWIIVCAALGFLKKSLELHPELQRATKISPDRVLQLRETMLDAKPTVQRLPTV